MATMSAEIWRGSPFCIQREDGNTPGLIVFRMSGPFTARDMYNCMAPAEFQYLFESTIFCERPHTLILDLTAVPYLDSAGIGVILHYFAICKAERIRMTVIGAGLRVRELFRAAKVDSIIPVRANRGPQYTCFGYWGGSISELPS